MSRLKADELAREISNFVNGASVNEVEQLAELMSKDHPTLQQSTMRLACLFIEVMAKKAYTDARNKQSKDTAIAMVNGYKKSAIEEIIKQDGGISTSLRTYLEEQGVPSKSLGTI
jgi:predicted short-subunit dehydrogenase-like oxidoreductase (DUF2520 family)